MKIQIIIYLMLTLKIKNPKTGKLFDHFIEMFLLFTTVAVSVVNWVFVPFQLHVNVQVHLGRTAEKSGLISCSHGQSVYGDTVPHVHWQYCMSDRFPADKKFKTEKA